MSHLKKILVLITFYTITSFGLNVGVVTHGSPSLEALGPTPEALGMRAFSLISEMHGWPHTFIPVSSEKEGLEKLQDGSFDVLVGLLEKSPKTLWSHGYFIGDIAIAIPKNVKTQWSYFMEAFRSFFFHMILTVAILLLVFVHFVWILERHQTPALTPYGQGILNLIWCFILVMYAISLPYPPKKTLSIFLYLMWILTGLVFVTSLGGLFFSSLTMSHITNDYKGSGALKGQTFALVDGLIGTNLKVYLEKTYKIKIIPFTQIGSALETAQKGHVQGILGERSRLVSILNTHATGQSFKISDISLGSSLHTFTFNKKYPSLDIVNQDLVKFIQNGILGDICRATVSLDSIKGCLSVGDIPK